MSNLVEKILPALTDADAPTIRKFELPEGAAILPPLWKTMAVEFLVNDQNCATILHDKPIPEKIYWAEYDVDFKNLTLVTVKGKVMGLGAKIQPPIHKKLRNCKDLQIIMVQEKQVKDFYKVSLVVRDTRHLDILKQERDEEDAIENQSSDMSEALETGWQRDE
ncbi:MAG: hypothetical protein GC136_00510 [Alphaproteobacteria bacterium]|nr:hypothetical protein [Alphaproteobacteria bacterium]